MNLPTRAGDGTVPRSTVQRNLSGETVTPRPTVPYGPESRKAEPPVFECERCGRDQYSPLHDPESFLFDHRPRWRRGA